MAAPELSANEVAFLAALERHQVRYLLVGLGAAAMQGAVIVTQDVDLWFERLNDPNLTVALKEIGAAYVPPIDLNPPMFAGAGLELFDIVLRMDGLKSFADEFVNRKEVSIAGVNVPILPLERILVSKRASNRLKDRLVLPVLEDALKAQEATGR